MPNIPFLTFPSVSGVSRYEHSVGVADLAWWWGHRVGLNDDDAEALCLAALYHDAATPALSHLFEEFLRPYGFNHESELARVLGAESSIPGRHHVQVFLGCEPLLRRVLAARPEATGRLSTPGIVRLSSGADPLGVVVHGDLDLDNIDNVIRATTAMGLLQGAVVHPYEVASELTWEEGQVRIASDAGHYIARWRRLRRILYEAILQSKHEFLAQTALKWAIDSYAEFDPAFLEDPRTWTLTEPELLFDRLRNFPFSRELVDRLRLGRVPELLASTWIADASELLAPGAKEMKRLVEHLRREHGRDVYANFYIDKRERPISLPRSTIPTLFLPDEGSAAPPNGPPGAVIGIVSLSRPRSTSLEGIRRALDAVLGSGGDGLSTGWLGDPKQPRASTLL